MEFLSDDDVAYLSARFRELTSDLTSKYGLADPYVETVLSPSGRWLVVITDPLSNQISMDLVGLLVDGIELAIQRLAVGMQERATFEDNFLDGHAGEGKGAFDDQQ